MYSSSQQKLSLAVRYFREGKVAEADHLALEALEINPKSADALHLRGVIAGLENRHADAEHLLKEAVNLEQHNHYLFFNLGKSLIEQGKDKESLTWHRKAIALDPDHDKAWLNLGKALFNIDNVDDAISAFDRALAINKTLAEAYTNKANCLRKKGYSEQSLALHDQAIDLNHNLAEAWNNRGVALSDLGRHNEAVSSFERTIDLNPDYAEAWCNRSVALNELKRHEEALASCDQAIKIKPDYADAYLGRGVVLNDLMRYEEALADYDRAIELKPDCAKSWSNRGITLNDLRRYEEALASYDRSIELKPGYTEAIHNKAILQLAQKEFLDGFDNYICRWETENFPSQHIKTTLPRYSPGAPVANILLWAEQGLGDEIFYAGILNQVSSKFSNISLIADIRLHSIIMRSFPKINLLDRRCSKSESFDSGFDCQAPIGDLGRLLALCGEEIKAPRTPFFTANRNKKTEFRLSGPFTKGKIICGLSWGSSNKNFGKEKSINLGQLEPILKDPRLEFVNLQYGEVDSEIQDIKNKLGVNIRQINDLDIYNDIDGLLALIDACDIVITTSNVTAHLAGSIGKKGCVLVPFSRGKIWYWHLNDTYSFWYPSLRIVYQNDQYTWSDTIEQTQIWLKQELRWNQ